MKKEIFNIYICEKCNNIVELIDGKVNDLSCCGNTMKRLEANTFDAAVEKHVPIYEKVEDELLVRVGEVEHPMEKEHYIMWIALVTDNRVIKATLFPEQATETRFPYIKGASIYAYCNKHGLWKAVIE